MKRVQQLIRIRKKNERVYLEKQKQKYRLPVLVCKRVANLPEMK